MGGIGDHPQAPTPCRLDLKTIHLLTQVGFGLIAVLTPTFSWRRISVGYLKVIRADLMKCAVRRNAAEEDAIVLLTLEQDRRDAYLDSSTG